MPLRDHFRPPVSTRSSWEGFHGMWPAVIVQHLVPLLPDHYTAEPRVHLGAFCEIDVSAFEDDRSPGREFDSQGDGGGASTATWSPPQPTFLMETDVDEQYEYEVRIYDQSRARQLVAAVELVSPANKDRPSNRLALVAKCAALLRQGVCVSLVDVVTTRRFNLYAELLEFFDRRDPAFAPDPPWTYAATCRRQSQGAAVQLGAWAHPLIVGQPLPTIPLWLSDELAVSLDLEASYEATCATLRIA